MFHVFVVFLTLEFLFQYVYSGQFLNKQFKMAVFYLLMLNAIKQLK